MRSLATLAAVGAAAGALAMTATRTPSPAPAGSTYDVLPVVVGAGVNAGIDFFEATTGGVSLPLARSLGVFAEPRRASDALPPELSRLAGLIAGAGSAPLPGRSRLLLAHGTVRIYGIPTTSGGVCYFRLAGDAGCAPALLHGALPQIVPGGNGARGLVWGLVDDDAAAVDVRVQSRWRRAVMGRNAFYAALPAGAVAPERIVVRERGGARHVYAIKRCRVGDITPLTGVNPLSPPLC